MITRSKESNSPDHKIESIKNHKNKNKDEGLINTNFPSSSSAHISRVPRMSTSSKNVKTENKSELSERESVSNDDSVIYTPRGLQELINYKPKVEGKEFVPPKDDGKKKSKRIATAKTARAEISVDDKLDEVTILERSKTEQFSIAETRTRRRSSSKAQGEERLKTEDNEEVNKEENKAKTKTKANEILTEKNKEEDCDKIAKIIHLQTVPEKCPAKNVVQSRSNLFFTSCVIISVVVFMVLCIVSLINLSGLLLTTPTYCSSSVEISSNYQQEHKNDPDECVSCPADGICNEGTFVSCNPLFLPRYIKKKEQFEIICVPDGDIDGAVSTLARIAQEILSIENGKAVCSGSENFGLSDSELASRLKIHPKVFKMSSNLFSEAKRRLSGDVLSGFHQSNLFFKSDRKGSSGDNILTVGSLRDTEQRWHTKSISLSMRCRISRIFRMVNIFTISIPLFIFFLFWWWWSICNEQKETENLIYQILKDSSCLDYVNHSSGGVKKYCTGMNTTELIDEMRRRNQKNKMLEKEFFRRKVEKIIEEKIISDSRLIRTKMYVSGKKETFISYVS